VTKHPPHIEDEADGVLIPTRVTPTAEIDALVANATKALAAYATFTQADVDHIVKKAAIAALDKHGALAELAVRETRRGVFEDKAVKNIFACESVTNSMSGFKTVGVVSRDELTGIVEIAEPVGVICGNAMVRAAYSCGKPARGVGAGNVPAYIEKSAKLKRAVNDVVLSKAFDNGMICASEQAVILDDEIYDAAMAEFAVLHAYRATKKEKVLLEKFIFGVAAKDTSCGGAKLNVVVVGQGPVWIAEQAGFHVPADTAVLLAEVSGVGPAEPLTREKLAPVLAVLRATSTEHGIRFAEQMVEFDGLGHSAAIHTRDDTIAEEFGSRVKAVRIIRDARPSLGGIGDIYNAYIPSMTLGCASYGANSVSNNVSAINLMNISTSCRAARRRSRCRSSTPSSPSRACTTVQKGAAEMRAFRPDTIIAFGGGSPMGAAKVMWLLYEHPEIVFSDLKQKYFDVRKRAFRFPVLGGLASLVCIPTTSGTGAEMTPFAVITDTATGKKYPLADYALTPTVAIIDPVLTAHMPASLAADSGFDALTHATEAYVSVHANDFTDGMTLQAIRLIFDNLAASVNDEPGDPLTGDAREKMHNAGTIAGMAFGNALLGIVHAMAHTVGSTFHLVHGRTNAVLLPHVIRYNGTVPSKLTSWPKYEHYVAPERFQQIAAMLGLPAATPAEGVESCAQAVEALRAKVGVPSSFASQGVAEAGFIGRLDELAMGSYEDLSSPGQPPDADAADMKDLMTAA